MKAERVIGMLFEEYIKHIELLPEEFQQLINDGEEKEIVVCDYIAGMTDNYAVTTASELFIPKSW